MNDVIFVIKTKKVLKRHIGSGAFNKATIREVIEDFEKEILEHLDGIDSSPSLINRVLRRELIVYEGEVNQIV